MVKVSGVMNCVLLKKVPHLSFLFAIDPIVSCEYTKIARRKENIWLKYAEGYRRLRNSQDKKNILKQEKIYKIYEQFSLPRMSLL